MMSHISSHKNKIFLENSPERKSHDNMLRLGRINARKISLREPPRLYSDEANVIEKMVSSKIMTTEMFNEIMISKQEKLIKAYT